MNLIDTHCHPYFDELAKDEVGLIKRAKDVGVNKMIAVGVDLEGSRKAIEFASKYPNVWASAGVHPHDAAEFRTSDQKALAELLNMLRVVAIGEIGLDYYRLNSPKQDQISALRKMIETGLQSGLPFIFHARDAWADFWQTLDEYQGIRGVVHSFTGGPKQLEQALSRGLTIALNGIVTFTKDQALLEVARTVPLESLVLETDAPFLTPANDKGQVCEPKHVRQVAEFLAEIRNQNLDEIADKTTKNAIAIFGLNG